MNGLDGIFILAIVLAAIWGFKIGVIGAAIWLIAAYISVVLGANVVGWTLPRLGLPENFASLATSFAYILASAVVFMVARAISLSLRSGINFTPLRWANDIGGAILGLVFGVFGCRIHRSRGGIHLRRAGRCVRLRWSLVLRIVFTDLLVFRSSCLARSATDRIDVRRDVGQSATDHCSVRSS